MRSKSTVEAPIDSLQRVETPEGIDLEAELAGPVPRILAYTIDVIFRWLLIAAVGLLMLFTGMGRAGWGVMLILMFLLEWFYPVCFEVLRSGQTPGKKRMGLAVVNDDLTPVSWGTSLVRNLLRVVDFMPLAYLFGLLSMAVSGRFQRLGDLAAGTLVVHRSKAGEELAVAEAAPVAPPVPLELEEQRAIVSFTQRQQQLSEARRIELASITAPVFGHSGPAAVEYLCSLGAWLMGARNRQSAGNAQK